MKTVANRLIVFAASALALGTVAFGQTRITAEIPFAFHTASGTLPAGTYDLKTGSGAARNMVYVLNRATLKTTAIGVPIADYYKKATEGRSSVEFLCRADACTLKAIKTTEGALVYPAPRKSRSAEKDAVAALVTIPLKVSNGE